MAKKNKMKLIKILLGSITFMLTSYIVYNQIFISDCRKVSRIEKQILDNQTQHSNKIEEITNSYRILGVHNEKIDKAVRHSIFIDENDEEMNTILIEEERLSKKINNIDTENNCEGKPKIIEKLKLIKNQKYSLIQKKYDDELSLALKYQAAPKHLISIFNTVKDTANIKFVAPVAIGMLLNKLLIYKLDPDIPDFLKLEMEDAAFLLLENRIQEPNDYYSILKHMLAIDKKGSICLETYKDKNESVQTRDVKENPNYILDNEKKIREWLLESSKNQKRLDSLLTKKGIHTQKDWYVNKADPNN